MNAMRRVGYLNEGVVRGGERRGRCVFVGSDCTCGASYSKHGKEYEDTFEVVGPG